ncbi:uncharacterized protein ACRADG_011018 [Cochliomyia hominivorax]
MKTKIPYRWKDYKPVGKKIEGTRFIAFKVPLKEHIARNVESAMRLDGNILLKTVPNLGLIIDLTNTKRYYDPDIFEKAGVEYKKLMLPGHVTPSEYQVHKFIEIVKDFVERNPDNDKLIGVHCTHGVNRTGYLICNYMISQMTIEPNEALNRFANSRGHRIERNYYIDALQQLKTKTDNWRAESKDRIERNTCNEYKVSKDRKPNNINTRKESIRDYIRDIRSKYNNLSKRSNAHFFANNWRNDHCRPTDNYVTNNQRESNRNHAVSTIISQDNNLQNLSNLNHQAPPLRIDYYNNQTINRSPHNNNNMQLLPQNEGQLIIPNHMSNQQQPAPPRLRLDYYKARPVKDNKQVNYN